MKIIDLGWLWRSPTTRKVGYHSDSWAFCSLKRPVATPCLKYAAEHYYRIYNITSRI